MDIVREIGAVIVKLLGVSFGLGLIAVILIWFGIIPMVAVIFQQIGGWLYLGLTALMIFMIIAVVRYVIK